MYSGANAYPATNRGPDWYTKLIAPVLAAEPTSATGVTVIAAQDIEAGFAGTLTQVTNWESSYFATTGTRLLFNGSLDGCPTSFTSSNATCDRGWTLADYYGLAHHSAQVQVLPEAYNSRVPIQWTDVDAVGHGGLEFAGSLTEYGAGDSYPPEQGGARCAMPCCRSRRRRVPGGGGPAGRRLSRRDLAAVAAVA